MARHFWAEDRVTGERWQSCKKYRQYLVMYDSGYLGVVTHYGRYEGDFVLPLDNRKWKVVLRDVK